MITEHAKEIREKISLGGKILRETFSKDMAVGLRADALGMLLVGCLGWREAVNVCLTAWSRSDPQTAIVAVAQDHISLTVEEARWLVGRDLSTLSQIETQEESLQRFERQRPTWRRGN